jgi:hypothetical protein
MVYHIWNHLLIHLVYHPVLKICQISGRGFGLINWLKTTLNLLSLAQEVKLGQEAENSFTYWT